MTFTPFARYRNFTLENLKHFLEIYPKEDTSMSLKEAIDYINNKDSKYARTSYQQACQWGLENRSNKDRFEIQRYLYNFTDEGLKIYLNFWFKLYFVPNPYINIKEECQAFNIFTTLAREIIKSSDFTIKYKDFFQKYINEENKSTDILLNSIKEYAYPIQYKKENDDELLFIEKKRKNEIEFLIEFIDKTFPIGNFKDKKAFFDRFSYENFNKFYFTGIEKIFIKDKKEKNILDKNKKYSELKGVNRLFYGVPGCGKSYKIDQLCSDERFMERVVFHPDYMYSDFVGQIMPNIRNTDNEKHIDYKFIPGPFSRILAKAYNDPNNMYYLIIEELNRGNAPAIFGEIFQLLDRDNTGKSKYGINNADIASLIYHDEEQLIKIPSNLSILATMNTAAQNIFVMDTAFQRRWQMEYITNNFDNDLAKELIEGTEISWGTFAQVVNRKIIEQNMSFISTEDKRLGAFFIQEEELSVKSFSEKVLKYLWDDAFKMNRDVLFKEDINTIEDLFEIYNKLFLEGIIKEDVYDEMLNNNDV